MSEPMEPPPTGNEWLKIEDIRGSGKPKLRPMNGWRLRLSRIMDPHLHAERATRNDVGTPVIGRGGYGAGNKTASELRRPPPSACKGAVAGQRPAPTKPPPRRRSTPDHQAAYDAVYAIIRSLPLPDERVTELVERNALIWRCVQAALDAEVEVSDEPIPPPTDRQQVDADWLTDKSGGKASFEPVPMTGGWFVTPSKPRKAGHQCRLPQEWALGALWRCSEGHLWVVRYACECQGGEQHRGNVHTMGLAWWPSTWRQRRTVGPGMKRADLSMASRSVREELGVKPQPQPPSPPLR